MKKTCSIVGATTFSITTLRIMTLRIMGLFATLRINDTASPSLKFKGKDKKVLKVNNFVAASGTSVI